jgi:hypothetical protein
VPPRIKRRLRIAAAILAFGAIVATAVMIWSGFITAGPSWLITVVGSVVALSAICAVLCLFLILFD